MVSSKMRTSTARECSSGLIVGADGDEDAAPHAVGEGGSLLRTGPPETARRLRIMAEHDEIDRQSLGIRGDLVDRIAGRQIPLGDHATRLQPLERLIQQL